MRLIDADALREKVRDEGVASVYRNIQFAPTIDAVPVEWIKKYMSRCLAIEQDAIGEMVKEWAERKEE